MLFKSVLSLTVTAACLLASSAAFATELGECDPEQDANECSCDGSSHDVCTVVAWDDLLTFDDPAAIREAANIQTVYNSNKGVYEVTLDVTAVAQGEIFPVHSNNGHWQTRQQLQSYVSALLGVDLMATDLDECYVRELPFGLPFEIDQIGNVFRWDQHSGAWANFQNTNIIYAAISDGNGEVYIEDLNATFSLATALSDACDQDTSGDASGRQCSQTATDIGFIENTDVCTPDSIQERPAVQSRIEAQRLQMYGVRDCLMYSQTTGQECEVFRINKYVADEVGLWSVFYDANAQAEGVIAGPGTGAGKPNTYFSEAARTISGICSIGWVNQNQDQVVLETRAGSSPSNCLDQMEDEF